MAEGLTLGFGETASVEMLPEDGGCRPKARAGAGVQERSSAHWPLTCCLLSIPYSGRTHHLPARRPAPLKGRPVSSR